MVGSPSQNAPAALSLLSIGMSASTSVGLVYASQAESTGILMLNAVHNEQAMQQITNAAVAQTLVMILALGTKPG